MDAGQILSCGGGYPSKRIAHAYVETVRTRPLRGQMKSVKSLVQRSRVHLKH